MRCQHQIGDKVLLPGEYRYLVLRVVSTSSRDFVPDAIRQDPARTLQVVVIELKLKL